MTVATIKQAAFAALDTASNPPHICAWTVSGTASLVREKIGKAWNPSDPKAGWTTAKTKGLRVVKLDLIARL